MQPSVYLVVLSWNNVSDVIECLESLKQLDYANCHVVLVDNGSTDNTIAIVRERFSNVKLIANEYNLGYTEGNNVGIRFALANEADYIFILNDDTVATSEMVTRLVQIAEQDSKIGMVGPSIVSYFDHSCEYIGASINWSTGATAYTPSTATEIEEADYLAGCALMIKSKVVREIGLLDAAYFCYFEDADWGVRCHRAGFRVVTVPQAKIYHKGTPDNIQHDSPELLYFYSRNQYAFMRRYAAWHNWLLFLFHYSRRCFLQFYALAQMNDTAKSDAVMDGYWAGITGKSGAERIVAPMLFKRFVYNLLRLSHRSLKPVL